jgi:hypothetical protein
MVVGRVGQSTHHVTETIYLVIAVPKGRGELAGRCWRCNLANVAYFISLLWRHVL